MRGSPKMLELKNIKKSFGGTEVLKNVGLSVAKGDVVAILCLLYTSDAADE